MKNLLYILQTVDVHSFVASMLLLVVPTAFCLLIWYRSPLVRSLGRLLSTMVVLSLIGWAFVVVECLTDPMPENGFAVFCGMFLGWVYPWLFGIPILLFSFVLHVLFSWGRRIGRKEMRRDSLVSNRPLGGAAVLLVGALIVYPICLSVKPEEKWHEWCGKQYRAIPVDGMVHVQIREAGRVVDIRSDASAYHRFGIEQMAAEELVLWISDVGRRILRKVDGRWMWQEENP
ncbi:MAG: hypothetical protein Q4G65_16780 [bacterium]|nr:hypothetical protein [bacterium]